MNQHPTPKTAADCNPTFSIAGVMPCASQMAWKTAYPNPDAGTGPAQPRSHGPSFSIAGVMPGTSEAPWRTAMPDPSRDVLDASGHVITMIEARDRLALAAQPHVRALRRPRGRALAAARTTTSRHAA